MNKMRKVIIEDLSHHLIRQDHVAEYIGRVGHRVFLNENRHHFHRGGGSQVIFNHNLIVQKIIVMTEIETIEITEDYQVDLHHVDKDILHLEDQDHHQDTDPANDHAHQDIEDPDHHHVEDLHHVTTKTKEEDHLQDIANTDEIPDLAATHLPKTDAGDEIKTINCIKNNFYFYFIN